MPCRTYAERLDTCVESINGEERVQNAAKFWRRCAVKKLRYDENRNLESQMSSAISEVCRLCHSQLRKSDYIVSLRGWGLCLDSLESPRPGNLKEQNAISPSFSRIGQNTNLRLNGNLSDLALDIGSGLHAIHMAKICHGDLKLDNILVFDPDYVPQHSGHGRSRRWRAKICDFGSTHDANGNCNDRGFGSN